MWGGCDHRVEGRLEGSESGGRGKVSGDTWSSRCTGIGVSRGGTQRGEIVGCREDVW